MIEHCQIFSNVCRGNVISSIPLVMRYIAVAHSQCLRYILMISIFIFIFVAVFCLYLYYHDPISNEIRWYSELIPSPILLNSSVDCHHYQKSYILVNFFSTKILLNFHDIKIDEDFLHSSNFGVQYLLPLDVTV